MCIMRLSNMKIWVHLLLTIGAAVIVWQNHVYRETAIEQARGLSVSMHEATTARLTGMMVTGTVMQRDAFLDQVKQLKRSTTLSARSMPTRSAFMMPETRCPPSWTASGR
jgi:hypothetical protein